MNQLQHMLRSTRMEHQAPTRQHPFSINENALRLLALIRILSQETPKSCRFVHVVTAGDIGGIPHVIENNNEDEEATEGCVHDWTLAAMIHECIIHKVLDYELSLMSVTSPATMYMQIPLEAHHDLEQMRAAGLITIFEFTTSRFANCTLSGSPGTTGERRGGRVCALRLSPKGLRRSELLLRGGVRELTSIVRADVGAVDTIPRRVVWHSVRREFLLCEALQAEQNMGGTSINQSNSKAAPGYSPSRYRSPLPLPPSPLKSPVHAVRRGKMTKIVESLENVTRALRSTMTSVRMLVPNYVVSPLLLPCLQGCDINGSVVSLRASNRALAEQFVQNHTIVRPTRNQQLAYEAESLNELCTVMGTYGVHIIQSRWLAGVDQVYVRKLNRSMEGGNCLGGIGHLIGEGVGSTRVYDDVLPSNQCWRTSNETRSNAGETKHVVRSIHSVKEVPEISEQLAMSTSSAAAGSPKLTGKKKQSDAAPSSPSSSSTSTSTIAQNGMPPSGTTRGARVLEVLGTTSEAGGRGDVRSVFTAECADSAGQLGESVYSIESDGCVLVSAAIDCVGDRLAFVGSVAEAGRISHQDSSDNRIRTGVSLDRLSKCVVGMQMTSVDVLKTLLMDHGDPSSMLSSRFSDVYGAVDAEPSGHVVVVVGSIRPFMKPVQYMDGNELQLRFTPLIGPVRSATEIGFGETLFVGRKGTLLVSKRPEGLHPILLAHSRLSSKSTALDALASQIEWIQTAVVRIEQNEREVEGGSVGGSGTGGSGSSGCGSSNAPLASGVGCDDAPHLASRLCRLNRILNCLLSGMDHEDDMNDRRSPQTGTNEAVYRNDVNEDDARVRELRRILQITSLSRSIVSRAKCLLEECCHLRTITESKSTSYGYRGSGELALQSITTSSSAASAAAAQNGTSSMLSMSSASGVTSNILLSGFVAFMAIEAIVVNDTLSLRERWSYLLVCLGLWVLIVVVVLTLPTLSCWHRYCGPKHQGPKINIHVVPQLRVKTTTLERTLLSEVDILEDALQLPRFVIGGASGFGGSDKSSGAARGAERGGRGGHKSAREFTRRQRKGCRTLVLREPAVRLGWPSNSQWKHRYLMVKMVLLYDGGNDSSGDVATLQSLHIEMDSAPPHWPFKWLHELILSKWLQRLEDLNVCSVEDHHVCRQVLRLNTTVGSGIGH